MLCERYAVDRELDALQYERSVLVYEAQSLDREPDALVYEPAAGSANETPRCPNFKVWIERLNVSIEDPTPRTV
jgi:hypothetical protein